MRVVDKSSEVQVNQTVGLGGQAPRSKEPVVAVIYIKNRYFNEVNQLIVVIPVLGTYANVLFVDKKWADRISRYVLEHDADGIVKITASKLLEMIKTSEDWSEDTDAISLVSLLEQAIQQERGKS